MADPSRNLLARKTEGTAGQPGGQEKGWPAERGLRQPAVGLPVRQRPGRPPPLGMGARQSGDALGRRGGRATRAQLENHQRTGKRGRTPAGPLAGSGPAAAYAASPLASDHCSQLCTMSPDTRENSSTLAVTNMALSASACEAMSKSLRLASPLAGVPLRPSQTPSSWQSRSSCGSRKFPLPTRTRYAA